MKIVEPSVELIDFIDGDEVLKKIERCGRVCYQSEPKGQPEKFIRARIKSGHESVLEHVSLTFHIICDRAIMAELTRHRLASFSVESTRYCKYDELTIINPPTKPTAAYTAKFLEMIEQMYRGLIEDGNIPEEARAVLPLCLKTELYMTANLRELRTILKLRCAKTAHPQMRQIMLNMLSLLYMKLPVIFGDIWEVYKNECTEGNP